MYHQASQQMHLCGKQHHSHSCKKIQSIQHVTLSQCGNFIVHIYMTLHKWLSYGSTNTRQKFCLPVLTAIKVYIKLFKDFFSFSLNKQPLKREKFM